jgi:predicted dinucleotide-binding enzyme
MTDIAVIGAGRIGGTPGRKWRRQATRSPMGRATPDKPALAQLAASTWP